MEKIISEIVEKLGKDKDVVEKFLKDPKAMLSKWNIDVPEDKIQDVVEAVKAKVHVEGFAEKGKELLHGLEGMFKK